MKNPTYESGFEPFIPHLHMEDLLSGIPLEDREDVIGQVNDALERSVADDRVHILTDENGNFIYELTEKGIKWAKRLLNQA